MTAQHNSGNHQDDQHVDGTDPLGPINLPKRSKVGARAMALVGTLGMSTFAHAVINTEPGWPITSISVE